MARYCPVLNARVVYLTCQECEDRVCEKGKTFPKDAAGKKADEPDREQREKQKGYL